MMPNDDYFDFLVQASLVPAAVYLGNELIIKAANQPMFSLLQGNESLIGQSANTIPFNIMYPAFFSTLKEVMDSGNDCIKKEIALELNLNNEIFTHYFSVNLKALKDKAGLTYAVFSVATDITDQVLKQRQDFEMKERFAFSLKSAGIGIWDLDPGKKTINWDTRCRALMGYTVDEEASYNKVLKCIHRDDIYAVYRAILSAMNPDSKEAFDIRFRTIDKLTKEVKWVNCKGHAYFNNAGIVYRFAGTVQDINEEIKARAREEQMLSLINNNSESMSIADLQGNYLYMNMAGKKMFGIDAKADITDYNTKDFFYNQDDFEEVTTYIEQEQRSNFAWSGSVLLKNITTNEAIPSALHFILINDPETGKLIGRGGLSRDLRPEIKIKTEQQRLNKIVDSSEDFINYCDLEGNTLYINSSGLKLIGLTKNEIENKSLYEYHSEKSIDLIKNEILPILHKKGKWSGTLELKNQITGEIIPIHKQMYMIKEEFANMPIAIAGIARDLRPDINANKAINEKNIELQNAIKEMEFLANSVPSVVWRSNTDGKLDYVNRRWYEQVGRDYNSHVTDSWTDNVHPDDVERANVAWSHSLKTGEPYDIEFRCLGRNNEYQWYLVRGMPLRDDAGKIIKWYGSNTNIQVQKELEKQKDDFLGVASHELKTPVTSLKAYAQIIETKFRKAGDLKNAEVLGKMNKQIDRLTVLISDLLDVTKLHTGRLQFNVTPFEFNEMIEEVVEELKHTSAKFSFVKKLNFKGIYNGDRERIYQVVTNFLTNAVKYSPNADTIIIYSDLEDNQIVVRVQDFGIGISADKKEKVFEQFYRVNGSKEITFPGLGLGLYVSAEIVSRLGGKIWVDSKENEGSVFGFSLPLS